MPKTCIVIFSRLKDNSHLVMTICRLIQKLLHRWEKYLLIGLYKFRYMRNFVNRLTDWLIQVQVHEELCQQTYWLAYTSSGTRGTLSADFTSCCDIYWQISCCEGSKTSVVTTSRNNMPFHCCKVCGKIPARGFYTMSSHRQQLSAFTSIEAGDPCFESIELWPYYSWPYYISESIPWNWDKSGQRDWSHVTVSTRLVSNWCPLCDVSTLYHGSQCYVPVQKTNRSRWSMELNPSLL